MNPATERGPQPAPCRSARCAPSRRWRALSFRAAADELHLTQSAVSRQISALEGELGATLLLRGTRHVELTSDGATLLRAVAPALDRLDASVRQIRVGRGRKVVSVTTFASFSSLWLIPRLEEFQRSHEDIDIRVSATDKIVGLDEPDLDLALRYCPADRAPAGAIRLFDETLTPVIGRWLAEQVAGGQAPPLNTPADLAQHALAEEDNHAPAALCYPGATGPRQGEAKPTPTAPPPSITPHNNHPALAPPPGAPPAGRPPPRRRPPRPPGRPFGPGAPPPPPQTNHPPPPPRVRPAAGPTSFARWVPPRPNLTQHQGSPPPRSKL